MDEPPGLIYLQGDHYHSYRYYFFFFFYLSNSSRSATRESGQHELGTKCQTWKQPSLKHTDRIKSYQPAFFLFAREKQISFKEETPFSPSLTLHPFCYYFSFPFSLSPSFFLPPLLAVSTLPLSVIISCTNIISQFILSKPNRSRCSRYNKINE